MYCFQNDEEKELENKDKKLIEELECRTNRTKLTEIETRRKGQIF